MGVKELHKTVAYVSRAMSEEALVMVVKELIRRQMRG